MELSNRAPKLRQQLADAVANRRAHEEFGLATAAALVALGIMIGLVTLPTAILGDLGGGYQAFMVLSSIGVTVATFLLALMALRRAPRAQ